MGTGSKRTRQAPEETRQQEAPKVEEAEEAQETTSALTFKA